LGCRDPSPVRPVILFVGEAALQALAQQQQRQKNCFIIVRFQRCPEVAVGRLNVWILNFPTQLL